MKKIWVSLCVIAASVAYVVFQNSGSSRYTFTVAVPPPSPSSQTTPQAPQTSSAPPAGPGAPTPNPSPVPSPTPQKLGQYKNGTYTGAAVDAYYGMVQVQALIQGGALADVTFLQYPSDRSTSRFINSQAMPILIQEAIRAQSANVDIVSGATHTSGGFRQSLEGALAQAK